MSRQIKIRIWDTIEKKFEWINLTPNTIGHIIFSSYPGRKILEQFTGLLDKNGKEIYEGDIVSYLAGEPNRSDNSFYKNKSLVKYENGAFWPRPIKEECEDSFYNYELKDLKVLGNIHENRELL